MDHTCMEPAALHFLMEGKPVNCKPFGHGHINGTFLVETDANRKYILQRINTHVFTQPKELMNNIGAITEYLQDRVDDPRQILHFRPTADGVYYYEDEAHEFWRCYEFAEGICLEAPESDEDFYQSAIAFGRFQQLLKDFPADTLVETIPNFHNTVARFQNFRRAVEEDKAGRAASVKDDIDFLLTREEEAGTLQRMLESGDLPLRVTHNDTKLNNVLLDPETRKALCVLDLDTVMPGLSLFDYGDSIRFGAATAAEDEQDLSKMTMDLHLFEVYTKGFLDACPGLTANEIDMLPMGAKVITLELASRFLADYLEGDHYFKTAYPEHNLVRARTQMKLAADMEAKWSQMQDIVKKFSK